MYEPLTPDRLLKLNAAAFRWAGSRRLADGRVLADGALDLLTEHTQLTATIDRVRARHQPKTVQQVINCGNHKPHAVCNHCTVGEVVVCSNITCCTWPCDVVNDLEPDDLDDFVAERMTDPAFAKTYTDAEHAAGQKALTVLARFRAFIDRDFRDWTSLHGITARYATDLLNELDKIERQA